MKTKSLLTFTFLLIFNIYYVSASESYVNVPVCFEFKTLNSVYAKTRFNKMGFQVIPKGLNDNQTEWHFEHMVSIGDTIATKGGQSQQYVKIIDIKKDYIEVSNWGWAKGVGSFNITEKIKFGCDQIE